MVEPTVDSHLVRGLQERAARALPPPLVERVNGWWLRYAPGCPWWVGSVLPHGEPSDAQLADLVARAERFYASHEATARFQVGPPACPDGLDVFLAERGYRVQSPMSLRIAASARVRELAGSNGDHVRLDDRPSAAWFAAARAVHGEVDAESAERELLARVEQPTAYASLWVDGRIVAVGRAVLDTGWAGVFDIGTTPDARGKGHARSVVGALARWACSERADRMYLQVERDNAPADRVYRRLGFAELIGYHYRSAA